jgi:hypothetical protein
MYKENEHKYNIRQTPVDQLMKNSRINTEKKVTSNIDSIPDIPAGI